jgi:hypothetical protein
MTRPLTKAQLLRLARLVARQRQTDPFARFLLHNMGLGAGIGAAVAAFILATDMFGLLSLMSRQSDVILTALSFVVGGMMFFAPLTLAVAVGRAYGELTSQRTGIHFPLSGAASRKPSTKSARACQSVNS